MRLPPHYVATPTIATHTIAQSQCKPIHRSIFTRVSSISAHANPSSMFFEAQGPFARAEAAGVPYVSHGHASMLAGLAVALASDVTLLNSASADFVSAWLTHELAAAHELVHSRTGRHDTRPPPLVPSFRFTVLLPLIERLGPADVARRSAGAAKGEELQLSQTASSGGEAHVHIGWMQRAPPEPWVARLAMLTQNDFGGKRVDSFASLVPPRTLTAAHSRARRAGGKPLPIGSLYERLLAEATAPAAGGSDRGATSSGQGSGAAGALRAPAVKLAIALLTHAAGVGRFAVGSGAQLLRRAATDGRIWTENLYESLCQSSLLGSVDPALMGVSIDKSYECLQQSMLTRREAAVAGHVGGTDGDMSSVIAMLGDACGRFREIGDRRAHDLFTPGSFRCT